MDDGGRRRGNAADGVTGDPLGARSPAATLSHPSLVAHIVVVGFHAQLGNRIEFAYPRLRGETILRSPRLTDTSDISDSPASPIMAALSPRLPRASPAAQLQDIPTGFTPPPALARSRDEDASRGYGTPTDSHATNTPPFTPRTGDSAASSRRMTTPAAVATETSFPRRASPAARGDWGALPAEWAHLPFMALPDGAHDLDHDMVFFSLPPDVHCVSCFRQVDAIDAVTHSASSSVRKEDSSVAARGSVQKSVVLLCRRPLFGFLADRLVQAVREYFDQGDFARTEALASLFHSLNVSLAHPTLALKSTLFQGISLRSLLQALGPQTLAVLKLILLEKRVVLYSHPVYTASSAVVALASIFPGALDTLAPAMPAIDISPDDVAYAMPLALFGPRDRVIFQPYAPLPVVSDLLSTCSLPSSGCLIGTSHNIGVLLASTAVNAARKTASQPTPPNVSSKSQPFQTPPPKPRLQDTAGWESTPRSRQEFTGAGGSATKVAESSRRASSATPARSAATAGFGLKSRSADYGTESGPEIGLRINALPPVDPSVTARYTVENGTEESLVTPSPRHLRRSSGANDNTASPQQRLTGTVAPSPGRGGGRLPVVDALVNMSTGKVTVAGPIEPLCRITRQERRFLRDLMVAASLPNEDVAITSSVTASTGIGPRPGTEEYIRARIRAYLVGFLGCVASVRGILGGPRGSETWNAEVVSHFDLSSMGEYNERFVHAWLQTRSAAQWSRRCSSVAAVPRSVPAPELDDSLADDPLLPVAVDRVAAGLSGIREFVSTKAVEGISSLFSRLETELGRIETAIGKSIAASPSEGPMALRGAADERLGSRNLEGRSSWQANGHREDPTLRTTRSTPSVFPPDAISGASTVPAVVRGRSADISLGNSRTAGSDPI